MYKTFLPGTEHVCPLFELFYRIDIGVRLHGGEQFLHASEQKQYLTKNGNALVGRQFSGWELLHPPSKRARYISRNYIFNPPRKSRLKWGFLEFYRRLSRPPDGGGESNVGGKLNDLTSRSNWRKKLGHMSVCAQGIPRLHIRWKTY